MKKIRDDWNHMKTLSNVYRQVALDFWQQLPEQTVAQKNDPHYPDDALMEDGIGAEMALQKFSQEIAPKLSASPGPRYWGFITGGITPAAVLGDWISSAVDQSVAVPGDSIASSVEQQCLRWLAALFGLPKTFEGVLTSGATASNLLGLVCARQFAGEQVGIDVTEQGLVNVKIEVFSASAHASTIKCLGISGLGRNFIQVPTLENREAIDVAQLAVALQNSACKSKIVVANCGTVTSNDFDDLVAVSKLCKKHNAWLHVDAAFGLFARLLPKQAYLTAGLELADSITGDAHKWLNVPYDSGIFYTRHIKLLEHSLAVTAPYLSVTSEAPTFMFRSIENSRRFRALPIWFTLMAYGKKGYQSLIESNCLLAKQLADKISSSDQYELLAPCTLNTVLFRARVQGDLASQNRFNATLLSSINASGKVFLSPGMWQGKGGFRAAISNWQTQEMDVDIAWDAMLVEFERAN